MAIFFRFKPFQSYLFQKVFKSQLLSSLALMNLLILFDLKTVKVGSGCGSIGRAVASDTRGPQFKSSHRQKFILNIVYYELY